jgi:hypothetical protein
MLQKGIKAEIQVAKAIGLLSSRSQNGNQEIAKETEVINRLAATKKELGVVPPARFKTVRLEHLGTLLVSRSVRDRQHEMFHLHHPVSLSPTGIHCSWGWL